MPYDSRESYPRRYDEDDERYNRGLDRPRYESGRYRDQLRGEYGGREFDREREYEGFGRNRYESRFGEAPAFSGLQRGARENSILVRLSDTDFDIADEYDIRGRTLIDQNGNDLGDVNDLIIEQQTRRVCYLLATSGGFLGIGGTMLLIPVELITRITNRVIAIDQRTTRGFSGVQYNPPIYDRKRDRGDYRGYDARYGSYSTIGRHSGRGPRGYRRSDDRIREEINDRLSDRGDLDASDIEVMVMNGEVTLTGNVDSRRDKRLAEDIAEDVSGVQNVENRLKVKQLSEVTTADRYDVSTPVSTEKPRVDKATDAAKASR